MFSLLLVRVTSGINSDEDSDNDKNTRKDLQCNRTTAQGFLRIIERNRPRNAKRVLAIDPSKRGGNSKQSDANCDLGADKAPEHKLIGRCEIHDLLSACKISCKWDESKQHKAQSNQREPEQLRLIHT